MRSAINSKLELLALADMYRIVKSEEGYFIYDDDNELCAFVYGTNEECIEYYVSGCYNSGVDLVEINMEALIDLKRFCELMVK